MYCTNQIEELIKFQQSRIETKNYTNRLILALLMAYIKVFWYLDTLIENGFFLQRILTKKLDTMLQEYRRYLEEYNVYSVLTVQTKLHTTLDKTSTDRTRSCVLADVVVLGKTPRILMRRNPSKKVKSLRELLKLMTSSQLYQSIPPLVARRSSE